MEKNIKEYELLRQEILQYLEEYQNLRNMMYIITVTLLGFCLNNENTIAYAYLLPLVVTIPSFYIYIDYFNNIIRAATYLTVFYEKVDGFPCQWESNLKEFNAVRKSKDYQQLPFIVCTLISLLLFLISMDKNLLNFSIFIVLFLLCTYIFLNTKKMKRQETIENWKEIKAKKNPTNLK